MITPTADRPLSGRVSVPGDKSIGHRALLLGALADGRVEISGLGDGGDNRSTARVLKQLGVRIHAEGDRVVVEGVGLEGLHAPDGPLDCGNSGTTMRILLGVLAGQPFEATLTGDESLSRRPMRRVIEPLTQMGLEVLEATDGTYPPLRVRGRRPLQPIAWTSSVASAQVKSAITLAGLWAEGTTSVREPWLSRDHTARMLRHLGQPPRGGQLHVPGDLSSAAFLIGAALLVPGSEICVEGVGVNPTRTGLLDVLDAMGAEITRERPETRNQEPMADLRVRHRGLVGTEVRGELAVRAIDELPLIATLAARARGVTHLRDAAELRVKESDRIARTVAFLRSFGVSVDEHPDGMTVHGDPDRPLTPGSISAEGDHRVAMCGALIGLVAPPGTRLEGAEAIATSYPGFFDALSSLGV